MKKPFEFKAIIFDMDGVLVNSEIHHHIIEHQMYENIGIHVSDEEYRHYVGMASDEMWAIVIDRHSLPHTKEEMLKRNNDFILDYFSKLDDFGPISGVEPLIQELQSDGIPMAVASSSSAEVINHLLRLSGLKEYFDLFVSGQMVEKSKPEPYIYLKTAEMMGVRPEECLVIEDSTNGIRAAKRAGMYCVAYHGVGYGGQDQSEADEWIGDFEMLLDRI